MRRATRFLDIRSRSSGQEDRGDGKMSRAGTRLDRLACKVSILCYPRQAEQMPNCPVPSRSHDSVYAPLMLPPNHWPRTAEASELSLHEVHVWAVPLNGSPYTHGELLSLLAPDEHKRAEQFRLELPRRQFVVA